MLKQIRALFLRTNRMRSIGFHRRFFGETIRAPYSPFFVGRVRGMLQRYRHIQHSRMGAITIRLHWHLDRKIGNTTVFRIAGRYSIRVIRAPLNFLGNRWIRRNLHQVLIKTVANVRCQCVTKGLNNRTHHAFLQVARRCHVSMDTSGQGNVNRHFTLFAR